MAFRFSLQTLLRLRQSLERQEELRLQEANQQVAQVGQQIEGVEQCLRDVRRRSAAELESGSSAAELQFALLCGAVLQQHRRLLENERARLEEVRARRREAYQQARRQREVLDHLRRTQLQAYRQQESRREQRRLDDAFLLRRAFLRRG